MEKKCYKCGSSNIARFVPASMAHLPEIKKEILEGRAIIRCCPAAILVPGLHYCKDCGFQWDFYYELSMVKS